MSVSRNPRMQRLAVGALAGFLAAGANAQVINVMPNGSADALAQSLLGPGVTLVPGSALLIGAPLQQGFFVEPSGSIIGFTDGIVLTSGAAGNVVGPNTVANLTTSVGTPGDPALNALSGFNTFDANVLQFRFTVDPTVVALGFNYVFASEEYNEFVGSNFNDVFAFFVDGQNVALVPGTNQAVAINRINAGNPQNATPPSNPQFYINNDPHDDPMIPFPATRNTQMDGLTTILFADVFAALNPNLTEHTIRFAIADASDSALDSAVFIQGGSFTVPPDETESRCQIAFEPTEPNNACVGPFGGQTIEATESCLIINGKLAPSLHPAQQPDTWLCVFDKFGGLIASDDNGSSIGNGKGSGLVVGDGTGDGVSDLLTPNGDGTYSLRLGVTGFPDGFDGNCNGLFQNAPHGQRGKFTVTVEYLTLDKMASATASPDFMRLSQQINDTEGGAGGIVIGAESYTDEFITGAEAFKLNFTAPLGAEVVRINIDNTVGRTEVKDDVDFMCVTGLEPLEYYCFTVVGGLDEECNPTDTQLCWLDKNCDVIGSDDEGGPVAGYSQLCVIADINGTICISVSGGGDDDCDGWVLDEPHGVMGTYSIQVQLAADMPVAPTPECEPEEQSALDLATRGDLNGDGIVDGGDLAILLSNWGLHTL